MSNAESHIVQTNFAHVLDSIERRLAESTDPGDLYSIFGGVDDDLFAHLTQKGFSGYDRVKAVLPDWAPTEVRQNSTGAFSFHDSVKEALSFWKEVKQQAAGILRKPLSECRVADYGAGWGRITRYLAKDIPSTNLYAVEPNPVFANIFEECRIPGSLVKTDWLSSEKIDVTNIDILISFSIYTHTSPQLAKNIRDRWSEMIATGGLVAFTIRPGAFLEQTTQEMAHFSEEERKTAIAAYERGELVYKKYKDSQNWGVTVAPMAYIKRLFEPQFKILGSKFFFQNWTQTIVFMVKN